MILFALSLTVILGIGALVIDLGVLRNNRQILANAVDAGALAAGTKLPVTGAAGTTALEALVQQTLDANYPGGLIKGANKDYTISYECLIGTISGQAAYWRDVPTVCVPYQGVGTTQLSAASFAGAGASRHAPCRPDLGDTCNTALIQASAITRFAIGPVVGVPSGSTGTLTASACSGPCGAAPGSPDDVVLVMDRTGSMSGYIPGIQGGAYNVMSVFNPALQRIALGTIGPADGNAADPAADNPVTCPKNSSSNWVSPPAALSDSMVLGVEGNGNYTDTSALARWVPVGFSGTDTAPFWSLSDPAARGHREAYSSGGAVPTNSTLYKAISCLWAVTGSTDLASPMRMAASYLSASGRAGVPKAIIFETDGNPNRNGLGNGLLPCSAAYAEALAAKGAGIEVFTLQYGSAQTCSSNDTGWTANQLLQNMASPDVVGGPSHYLFVPKTTDYTAITQAFTKIAYAITQGSNHLVTLNAQPFITSISPATGPFTGGTAITVTGSSFLGVTKVTVGGQNAAFSVNSDTSLTVVAPGGTKGSGADVIASSPGGSSPIVPADVFTYQ